MATSAERKLGGDSVFNAIGIAFILVVLFFSTYPLIWSFLNSFRTNAEMFMSPLSLPRKLDPTVFGTAWVRANFTRSLMNSLANSAGTVLIVILTGSSAAFALARMRFPGDKIIVKVLVSSIIISGQLILIPLFFVMRDLRIYNTLLSTILANAGIDLPLCIYLFYGFFKDIPLEIEESATIDGATRWTFYTRFIIPLSRPIFSTVIIFVALWSWNEYLYALTFLKDDAIRTIPLQLQNFFGRWSAEYSLLFAALSISVLPIIVLYIAMQGSFIKGLTAGAVKM
jgi:raffinose/stachyose/melibiose transport system permease protein